MSTQKIACTPTESKNDAHEAIARALDDLSEIRNASVDVRRVLCRIYSLAHKLTEAECERGNVGPSHELDDLEALAFDSLDLLRERQSEAHLTLANEWAKRSAGTEADHAA